MAYEPRIVKLSDSNKTTDYFPVSVTEAIYHKDSEGNVKALPEVLKQFATLPDLGKTFVTTSKLNEILSNSYYTKEECDDNYTRYYTEDGEVELLTEK